MSADGFAYVGRASCACIRSVIAESAGQRRVANEVARMIRDGLTTERVTCQFVRETPWTTPGCAEHARKTTPVAEKQETLL